MVDIVSIVRSISGKPIVGDQPLVPLIVKAAEAVIGE